MSNPRVKTIITQIKNLMLPASVTEHRLPHLLAQSSPVKKKYISNKKNGVVILKECKCESLNDPKKGKRELTLQLLLVGPTYLGVLLMLELLDKLPFLLLFGIFLQSFSFFFLMFLDLGGLRRLVAIAAFVRLSNSFSSSTASSIGTQIRSL